MGFQSEVETIRVKKLIDTDLLSEEILDKRPNCLCLNQPILRS